MIQRWAGFGFVSVSLSVWRTYKGVFLLLLLKGVWVSWSNSEVSLTARSLEVSELWLLSPECLSSCSSASFRWITCQNFMCVPSWGLLADSFFAEKELRSPFHAATAKLLLRPLGCFWPSVLILLIIHSDSVSGVLKLDSGSLEGCVCGRMEGVRRSSDEVSDLQCLWINVVISDVCVCLRFLILESKSGCEPLCRSPYSNFH